MLLDEIIERIYEEQDAAELAEQERDQPKNEFRRVVTCTWSQRGKRTASQP